MSLILKFLMTEWCLSTSLHLCQFYATWDTVRLQARVYAVCAVICEVLGFVRLHCWLLACRGDHRAKTNGLQAMFLLTCLVSMWYTYLAVYSVLWIPLWMPTHYAVAGFMIGPVIVLAINCFVHLEIRYLMTRLCRPPPPVQPRFQLSHMTYGELDVGKEGVVSCVVCLDDFKPESVVSQLACGHLFHEACIQRWFARQAVCPFRCNAKINEMALDGTGVHDS